jgi:hypothetical protein
MTGQIGQGRIHQRVDSSPGRPASGRPSFGRAGGRGGRRPGRGAFPAALLTLLVSIPPAVAKDKPPVHWIPAPVTGKHADPSLSVTGERAAFRDKGIVLEVELLDDRKRALFLESAGVEGEDPFLPRPGQPPVWSFLVRIENTSADEMHFRPQNVFFVTTRPVNQFTPCDFVCLYAFAERAGYDTPHREKLLHAALGDSLTIEPHGKLSKLLVFTRPTEKFSRFTLEFSSLDTAQLQYRFFLPYGQAK